MLKHSWNKIEIHMLCWVIYMTYEIMISLIMGTQSHFLAYLLFYPLDIALFYIHALYVLERRKPLKVAALIILELVTYIVVAILFSMFLDWMQLRRSPFVLDGNFIGAAIWRPILLMMYGTGYFFLKRYIAIVKEKSRKNLELAQMNAQLSQAESDFLRAQIAPHVLFNTLSFVKHATKHKPVQADEAIKRLSEILRFSIDRTQNGLISLEEEIRQVENILRINQLRYEEGLYVEYVPLVNTEGILVLPLIVVTMVENLFKHGNLSEDRYPARISLHCAEGYLTVETYNLIDTGYLPDPASTQTGLRNMLTRLQYAYGDDFVFQHGKEDMMYRGYLKMPYMTKTAL